MTDTPTGEETFGWPLPVCKRLVGEMTNSDDNQKCNTFDTNSFNSNAIADCLIVFVAIFITTTGIVLLVDKKKTAKNKSKKHPRM